MSVFDRNIALSVTAISNLLPRFFFSCSGNENAATYVRVFKVVGHCGICFLMYISFPPQN